MRRTIRLRENELKQIVKESVNRVLNETADAEAEAADYDEWKSQQHEFELKRKMLNHLIEATNCLQKLDRMNTNYYSTSLNEMWEAIYQSLQNMDSKMASAYAYGSKA